MTRSAAFTLKTLQVDQRCVLHLFFRESERCIFALCTYLYQDFRLDRKFYKVEKLMTCYDISQRTSLDMFGMKFPKIASSGICKKSHHSIIFACYTLGKVTIIIELRQQDLTVMSVKVQVRISVYYKYLNWIALTSFVNVAELVSLYVGVVLTANIFSYNVLDKSFLHIMPCLHVWKWKRESGPT